MPASDRNTVVITGADYATALGTARALSKLRLDVVGLCANAGAPCARSRIWSRIVTVRNAPDGYLDALLELGSRADARSVLFPSEDEVVTLISDNREELAKYYDFVLPDRSVLDCMIRKTAFHQWASEHGFLVPRSCNVSCRSELHEVLDATEYPVVIKPAAHSPRWAALSPNDKVLKLSDRRDLDEIGFDLFEAAPALVVQQWVPGGDDDVHYCLACWDRHGRELGYYTVRKVIQWPLGTGTAAAVVATSNHDVHRITHDVFREAGYRGLGSLEVKQSIDDGKYYIIEATVGRNDLNSPIATAGGVNLTLMAYHDAIGSDQPVSAARPRRATWINEYTLPAAVKRSGALAWWRALALLGPRTSFAYFRLTDPAPFLHLCKEVLGRKLRKLGDKFRKKP